MTTLPILELRIRCDELTAINTQLFRVLGAWVPDTTLAAEQQLFATAGRRHAWHAALWQDRRPSVPVETEQCEGGVIDPSADDRLAAYREAVTRLRDVLAELRREIDGTLDPPTARVIGLVDRDLEELGALATAVRR